MDPLLLAPLTLLAAYLVGGIPFGVLVARSRGVDLRKVGSGNIGATNVGRILGRRFGVLVFVLDFAKGALPVAAGLVLRATLSAEERTTLAAQLLDVGAGLAAFLGHLFPPYLGFRGGKGVATGAGVVAVLVPGPALAALAAWITFVCSFRYVSLASVAAALVLCLAQLVLTPSPFAAEQVRITLFCLLAAGLVLIRHRSNLVRLVHANENRLRDSTAMHLASKILHVLAVGLWFGTGIFFSFNVGFTLFHTFEAEAMKPPDQRPTWFKVSDEFQVEPDRRKDQGTRAAGAAIAPLFDQYFLLQGVCGLLAVITALGWSKAEPGRRVHSVRFLVLLAALATVVAGWPLERYVSDLRVTRNQADDQLRTKIVMQVVNAPKGQPGPNLEQERAALSQANAQFGMWHGISVLLNLVTLVLVTVGMALAAVLPGRTAEVEGQKAEVGGQKSEVRIQRSEVGSPGVAPEDSPQTAIRGVGTS